MPLGNLDGLEIDKEGNFLVSDWVSGDVFIVTPEGRVAKLLNVGKGSADIAFSPKEKMLIVPQMQESRVIAFELN